MTIEKVVPKLNKMEDKIFFQFSESALNLALKKSDEFISAFVGQIVFGRCSPQGFKTNQYFQINIFELHSFYLAIVEIIKGLSSELVLNKTIFCKNIDFTYFYSIIQSEVTKELIVCFAIEKNNAIIYESNFNETQLNTFLFALVKIIPSTLCFSKTDFLLFSNAADQNVKDIIGFQEELKCNEFVLKFIVNLEMDKKIAVNNLSTFLNYYCEIILVHHNLKILVETINKIQNHFDNIASIVSIETKN